MISWTLHIALGCTWVELQWVGTMAQCFCTHEITGCLTRVLLCLLRLW